MKKKSGLFLFLAFVAFVAMSCIGNGEDTIGKPTVEASGTTIIVGSAPIKDESFLSNIVYATIFRQGTKETKQNSSEVTPDFKDCPWINIGQVQRTESSAIFADFQFIDPYIETGTYYQYRIRYYNNAGYAFSAESDYVVNKNTACVGEAELTIDETAFLFFNRNDEDRKYTLTLAADSETTKASGEGVRISVDYTTLDDNKYRFEGLYIILYNGKIAKPVKLTDFTNYTVSSDTNKGTAWVVCGDSVSAPMAISLDLQKHLPTYFLDVGLTPQNGTLKEAKFFSLIAMCSSTDTNSTKYYWTPVATEQTDSSAIRIFALEYTAKDADTYEYTKGSFDSSTASDSITVTTTEGYPSTVNIIDAVLFPEESEKCTPALTDTLMVLSNTQPDNPYDTTPYPSVSAHAFSANQLAVIDVWPYN